MAEEWNIYDERAIVMVVLESLRAENKQLREQLKTAESLHEDRLAELFEDSQTIESLRAENEELKRQNTNLGGKSTLGGTGATIFILERERDQLREQCEGLVKKFRCAVKEANVLSGENSRLRVQIAATQLEG